VHEAALREDLRLRLELRERLSDREDLGRQLRLLEQRVVEHEEDPAVLAPHADLAEQRLVQVLRAEPLARRVHEHALHELPIARERHHDARGLHPDRIAADAHAHADAAPVVAVAAEPEAHASRDRRIALEHRLVVHVAARGQHDAAPRAHVLLLAADRRDHAHDAALAVLDQRLAQRVGHHLGAGRRELIQQQLHHHAARVLADLLGGVAARRGLRDLAERVRELAARVRETVVGVGIGADLDRQIRLLERHAAAGDPVIVLDAALAVEPDLLGVGTGPARRHQVLVHLLGVVLEAARLL
jgi:hypothetical protein